MSLFRFFLFLLFFTHSQPSSSLITHNFEDTHDTQRVLGRGALGFVFRGRVGLRSIVAIKKLDNEDKESSKAFYRELMIASSLRNPNIAPLVGYCIDPEKGLFLVYKYVSGGSLVCHFGDAVACNQI